MSYPPQPPTATTYGQPYNQPPKRKRTGLIVALSIVGVVVLLCSGIGLASCGAVLGSSSPDAVGSAAAAPDAHTSAPDAGKKPTAASSPTVLLQASGSGTKKTKAFRTGDSWSVRYHYDCSNFGMKGNFQVMEYAGANMTDVLVNELGDGGTDTTLVYDSGKHHLEVNSECEWSVTVTG